jgi:hypothetical protein
MARNISPPSATGGAGYNYADKVAAKYLLDMLAGRLPFGPDYGQVVRVEWETRDETAAWVVDDLRLTLRTGNADRFVAVSLKQNRQVTQSGFPSDFITDAWEMVLGKSTPEFSPTRDLLVLVVGQLSQNFHEAWKGLLGQAIETLKSGLSIRTGLTQNPEHQRPLIASSVYRATVRYRAHHAILHCQLEG